jgi:hypothetical protein
MFEEKQEVLEEGMQDTLQEEDENHIALIKDFFDKLVQKGVVTPEKVEKIMAILSEGETEEVEDLEEEDDDKEYAEKAFGMKFVR